jgi:imidazolonepropionase
MRSSVSAWTAAARGRRSGKAPPRLALWAVDMRAARHEVPQLATAGGAAALRRTDIARRNPGARADLLLLDAPLVSGVWRRGVREV